MPHFIIFVFIFLIVGCKEHTPGNTPGNTTAIPVNDNDSIINTKNNNSITGCYLYVKNRDSLLADLVQNEKEISGTLFFNNYQIDGSSGTVKGILDNEVLKLKYTFFAEGMNSVMDVYFKVNNDSSLIRGTGNMETKGDTAYFINPEAVVFPNETVLKKIDCNSIK
jgi:hypothetical protein